MSSSVSPRDKWRKVVKKVSSGSGQRIEKQKLERRASVLSTTSMNSIQEEETNQDEVIIIFLQRILSCDS